MNTTASFAISQPLRDAWQALKNTKRCIWSVFLVGLIITATIMWGIDQFFAHTFWMTEVISPLAAAVIPAPFYAGAIMVGIKRLRGDSITASTGFNYMHLYFILMLTVPIVVFLINAPSMLFSHPKIAYLIFHNANEANQTIITAFIELASQFLSLFIAAPLALAIPLTADKNYSPWKAIRTSYQLVKPHYFKVIITLLCSYLLLPVISMLSATLAILLGSIGTIIGSILLIAAVTWLLPWMILVQGAIYHRLVD